jgi:AcrR family transcriptional regulator
MRGPNEIADVDRFLFGQLEPMLTPRTNRLDPTNLRQRIAAAVIYENLFLNFSQISMPAIAKRAGVSTATLYRLFPDVESLYTAAFQLGLQLVILWLALDSNHPNPLYRLTELLARGVDIWTRPRAKETISPLYYRLCNRDSGIKDHVSIYRKHSESFWLGQFQRLKVEGYLNVDPNLALIEIFWGPVVSLFFYPACLTDVPYVSQTSNTEDCWRAADDFLTLYGTPHFHACRKKFNWDEDRAAFQSTKTT